MRKLVCQIWALGSQAGLALKGLEQNWSHWQNEACSAKEFLK